MTDDLPSSDKTVKLQKLNPNHREVLSLVAQGLNRQEIASITGFVPEYVSWLVRQDVCQEYLKDMIAVVDFRLHAMTAESVETIAEVMKLGTSYERLKAAKLQMEAVGRVGSGKGQASINAAEPDHLEALAERLVGLLRSSRQGAVYENESAGELVEVPAAGENSASSQQAHQPKTIRRVSQQGAV